MIKYVPEYIYEKYETQQFEGNFQGFALFFDIKDFTRITEALTRKGQKGAEVINKILEEAFSPVIEVLENEGGFVTGFAGDAFMSVFENTSGEGILRVFQAIRNCLDSAEPIKEISENYRLDARLVVSYGLIRWLILHNDIQNEYFFYGQAIEECNILANKKIDVLFSETALDKIGRGYFILKNGLHIPRPHLSLKTPSTQRKYNYSPQTVKSFLHKAYFGLKVENEIRDISNAFIYLQKIPHHQLRKAMFTIELLAARYEAFFNKLDYSDKGLLGILIFGAPLRREKTLDRMMYFAIELTNSLPDIKMGISSGRVYAGFTGKPGCQEYTILGYPPNLASRLMMKAENGQILVDIFSQELIHNRFIFNHLGDEFLKGFSQKLPVYLYKEERKIINISARGRFTGRKKELSLIQAIFENLVSPVLQSVYIFGDPGIGKSRLVEELRTGKADSEFEYYYLLCDGILKKPYAPVIRFLKEYFHYDGNLHIIKNEENFLKQWKTLAAEDDEMQRIESIIGQLLGYRWPDSVWELLPDEARADQERNALSYFFHFISKIKGGLIHLEDSQWLDNETRLLIERIFQEKDHTGLGIVICSRYNSDGSKPQFSWQSAETEVIELSALSRECSLQIVKNELELEDIPPETADFIISKGQGNPLFLEQISLYLKEQNYLDKEGTLQKNVEVVTAFGISDIIGARIDNLTEHIRQLVYYASVLGVEFDIQVLSAMLQQDLEKEAEMVVENCIWDKLRELHYIFSQILFRDTAYSRLLEEKLIQLNLLAADSYQKIYHKSELLPFYEIIGLHYERAGEFTQASFNYSRAFYVEYRNNRLRKALELASKALILRQKYQSEERLLIANCYYYLGLVYFKLGEYKQSLEANLKALPVFEEENAQMAGIIAILNNIGNAYSMLGKYQQALDYHGKSLLIRDRELGDKHPDFAMSLMHLGNIYMQTQKNEAARENYEKALEILLLSADKVPEKLVTCYNNTGAFYLQLENYTKSLEYLEKALPILEKMKALDKPRGAALYRQIGIAYNGLGDYDKAFELLQNAKNIEENIFGAHHPTTATTYDYLGRILLKNKKLAEAKDYFTKALNIYKEYYGHEHPATADIYQNLGDCLVLADNSQEGLICLKKSLEILQKIKPEDKTIIDVRKKIDKLSTLKG